MAIKNEKMKRGNALLQTVSKERDELYQAELKAIELGQKIFGKDFDPKDIYKDDFDSKAKQKYAETTQELQQLRKHNEELNEILNNKETTRKLQLEAQQKELEVQNEHIRTEEALKAEAKLAEQRARAKFAGIRLDQDDEALEAIRKDNENKTKIVSEKFNKLLDTDFNFRIAAFQVAKSEGADRPDVAMLPKIKEYMCDIGDNILNLDSKLKEIEELKSRIATTEEQYQAARQQYQATQQQNKTLNEQVSALTQSVAEEQKARQQSQQLLKQRTAFGAVVLGEIGVKRGKELAQSVGMDTVSFDEDLEFLNTGKIVRIDRETGEMTDTGLVTDISPEILTDAPTGNDNDDEPDYLGGSI